MLIIERLNSFFILGVHLFDQWWLLERLILLFVSLFQILRLLFSLSIHLLNLLTLHFLLFFLFLCFDLFLDQFVLPVLCLHVHLFNHCNLSLLQLLLVFLRFLCRVYVRARFSRLFFGLLRHLSLPLLSEFHFEVLQVLLELVFVAFLDFFFLG